MEANDGRIWARRTEAERRDAVVACLVRYFGPAAARPDRVRRTRLDGRGVQPGLLRRALHPGGVDRVRRGPARADRADPLGGRRVRAGLERVHGGCRALRRAGRRRRARPAAERCDDDRRRRDRGWSTTRSARCGCPSTRSGRPRPSERWRTSRSRVARSTWSWSTRSRAIKAAAAPVNARLGVIDPRGRRGDRRRRRPQVRRGEHDDQFPVDVFQTGSGTSTNMNVNEVIATLATAQLGRRVHPNDHVNASQSSNDVIPTAIRLAALVGHRRDALVPALRAPGGRRCGGPRIRFADVVKAGRTHLMDAVPVTLGQEFGGYATAIELGVERLRSTMRRLGALPLGGTAVGTGLNAPPGFAADVHRRAGRRARPGPPRGRGPLRGPGRPGRRWSRPAARAGSSRSASTSSRPTCAGCPRDRPPGCGEIHLPDLQPGSSIMPGKVNPVLPEAVHQVVAQVVGNDAAVAMGGASGAFELNVMLPVMADNLLGSIRLLGERQPTARRPMHRRHRGRRGDLPALRRVVTVPGDGARAAHRLRGRCGRRAPGGRRASHHPRGRAGVGPGHRRSSSTRRST